MDAIVTVLKDAVEVLTTISGSAQLAVIAIAGFIAWLLHIRWDRFLDQVLADYKSRSLSFTLKSIDRFAFPITMFLLVMIGRIVLEQFGWHVELLKIVMPLLLSLAIVRLVVYVLRKALKPGRAIKAWENIISTMIWGVVALHIVGWLPGILKAMDDLGITLGDSRITLLATIKLILSIGFLLLVSMWLSRVIESRVMKSEYFDPGMRVALAKVSKFFLLTLAILIALNSVGIDLTALTVFGGALGVGLGFGLQRIASNLVSGFILIFDRSIKPGDVITIGESFGWVQALHARYIVVRNREGVETLIPNENLVTSEVINWSYTDPKIRIKIPVQISYNDDPEQAMQLMLDASQANSRVIDEPAPACRLLEFADSGIQLELRVWIIDPQEGMASVRSDINLAIWRAFKQNNITIPFPQRDVHLIETS